MARLTALPSIEIIRGLKGILDFYLWKGLPCVRAWPTWRPARQSEASKAAALFFGAVVKSYSLLGETALSAYKEDALDQPRTARDIFITGVYGHLHEPDMSDFLGLLTECRDFLANLTIILNALDSVDLDQIVVNVDQSVLPPLAATTTNQAAMIAALQKLDDLQDALQSKGLDRLLVRGTDQLFSLKDDLLDSVENLDATAGVVYLYGSTVPAGQLWLVTHYIAWNSTSAISRIRARKRHNTTNTEFAIQEAPPAWQPCERHTLLLLKPGDSIQTRFEDVILHDWLRQNIHGYTMTLET